MSYKKPDIRHLRYLFISRKSPKSEFIDIACVTDNMNYFEYEMQFIQTALTYSVCTRIMSIFADFQIDSRTDVCYNSDVMNKNHPIILYMRIIHQQVPFNFKSIDFKNIVFISAERKLSVLPGDRDKSKITFKHANRLWRALLKSRQCPWITAQSDVNLKMLSTLYARAKMTLRLGAYYMVVKSKRQ